MTKLITFFDLPSLFSNSLWNFEKYFGFFSTVSTYVTTFENNSLEKENEDTEATSS